MKRVTKPRVLDEDVSQRKHHIPHIGDMIVVNGYGVRWDCHECSAGVSRDGATCRVCGPVPT